MTAAMLLLVLLAGAPDAATCPAADASLAASWSALDKGRWDEALGLLQPLAASHPRCGLVLAGLARVSAARGDAAAAERLFERATALAPGDARVHAQLAQYWLARGQQARADHLSALALSLQPDCADALVVQGRLLSAKGRMGEARQALERAVRADPDNVEASYQLGVWFFRARLPLDAARLLEKVTALRPVDARAHDYLALSLEGLGEAERAERAYRAGLDVNEAAFADPLLDYNYGRFLLKQGRYAESRSHLDRALELLPQRRGVPYERAKLNLALRDYKAAREDAERALGLRDPAGLVLDVQVYYLLATVYARLGETELARRYAELSRTTPLPDQDGDRRP